MKAALGFFLILAWFKINEATVQNPGLLWCPSAQLVSYRKQTISMSNVSIIADIQVKYLSGSQLSRSLYYHIAILGFDRYYLQVFYDDRQAKYSTRAPTIEDIYPVNDSCVMQWYSLGALVWEPHTYPGKESTWPTSRDGEKPPHIDMYKNQKGITPAYANHRHENRWVMVMDVDEYIVPVNYIIPQQCRWHHIPLRNTTAKAAAAMNTNTAPLPAVASTIIEGILQSITAFAATTPSSTYEDIAVNSSSSSPSTLNSAAAQRCDLGFTPILGSSDTRYTCTEFSYVSLPVHVVPMNKLLSGQLMPRRQSRTHMAYSGVRHLNRTEEVDGLPQAWKAMHRVASTSEIKCAFGQHHGTGVRVYSPREHHTGVLSMEVAHLKMATEVELPYYVKDRRIVKLVREYQKCMAPGLS